MTGKFGIEMGKDMPDYVKIELKLGMKNINF
jgi:hypothetical protein